MAIEIGSIWIKVRDDGDHNNAVGDRVIIVPHGGELLAWDYIPWRRTNCTDKGYCNAWLEDLFLKYYELDEVYLAKRIIEFYEEATTG